MKARLRQVFALVLAGIFCYIAAGLLPYFLRNLRLQRYMEELAQSSGSPDQVRAQVLDRARQLGLPLDEQDVRVESSVGAVRVAARYRVAVRLTGYPVTLHFSPSAGK